MQIEFKKEQIVKDKPQSILIDYVEYKLQCPKWMVKNNRAFLPLCTILILSHKCWEKPIYGLLPTFLNKT
ncbi:hypothetical protein [Spiroplasma endosymbiont of Apeira syringaria]|uniref:hypothetical protein n=1 Tax=Spiroplasma endosymbiont of Apeira syringaria TaxID=3066307 RepID=UPI0030D1BDFB